MPDWLRRRLLKDLGKEEEENVRNILLYFFDKSVLKDLGQSDFSIAKHNPKSLRQIADAAIRRFRGEVTTDHAIHDHVFVKFIRGKPQEKLAFRISRALFYLVGGRENFYLRDMEDARQVLRTMGLVLLGLAGLVVAGLWGWQQIPAIYKTPQVTDIWNPNAPDVALPWWENIWNYVYMVLGVVVLGQLSRLVFDRKEYVADLIKIGANFEDIFNSLRTALVIWFYGEANPKRTEYGLVLKNASLFMSLSISAVVVAIQGWFTDWPQYTKLVFTVGSITSILNLLCFLRVWIPRASTRQYLGAASIGSGLILLCDLLFRTNSESSILWGFLSFGFWYAGIHLLNKPRFVSEKPLANEAAIPPQNANTIAPLQEAPDFKLPEIFWKRVQVLMALRQNTPSVLQDQDEDGFCVGTYVDVSGRKQPVVVYCHNTSELVTGDVLDRLIKKGNEVKEVQNIQPRLDCMVRDANLIISIIKSRYEFAASITFKTEAELISELVDFEPYLSSLVRRFEEEKLPYSGRRIEDQKTLAETFILPEYQNRMNPEDRGVLSAYLDSWLVSTQQVQVALLGEDGMGKSSFLVYYAAKLARDFLSLKEQGDPYRGRIPFLISLRGEKPSMHYWYNELSEMAEVLGCKVEALKVLRDEGRLVFLMDAFDEMGSMHERKASAKSF